MKKRLAFFSLLLLFTMVLFACGEDTTNDSNGTEDTEVEQPEDDAQIKDTLNIAITAQPPTLDSAQTVSNVALNIAFNMYQQLFQLDENYNPTPVLATGYELSEDELTYTISLREGVTFHNGEEMVAEDVVASMNRWLTLSSRAQSLLEGATFSEVDTYTVQLDVPSPSSDVLIVMSARAQFPAIMPKDVIDNIPSDGLDEYIGTGPYQFDEWRSDQFIQLSRFEDYVAVEEAGDASGFTGDIHAPTENLRFYFVSDHGTRVAGIQTGQYDIADSIPIENFEVLSQDDSIVLESIEGGTLTAFFNTNDALLEDQLVREAILTALNMDEIMLASFANPELYSLNAGYMNPLQEQWATESGSDYYNQANIEAAEALLEEAGYDGEEIVLLTTRDYQEMYTGTLVIQEQLRQLGMNVTVENYDFPTFLETKNDPTQWSIFLASTGYQLTPPQLLAVQPDWAGLDDAFVREKLTDIRQSDPEAARDHWEELQLYMYEEATSSVLGHYHNVVARRDTVEGFTLFEAPIVWNAWVEE